MIKEKAKQKSGQKTVEPKLKGLFSDQTFALGRDNYILMAIGAVFMIIGYFLMAGTENIFSFTKTSLSVIFVIFGFLFEIYAIMKKPKEKSE